MTRSEPDDDKKEKSPLVKAGYVGAMGFEFVGVVIGSFILGGLVDDRFGVGPWGTVACLFAGMVAAGWHVYLIAKRLLLEDEE